MVVTLPLVLAVAAWLRTGSLAMRPERAQGLVARATPEVAVYFEANRSAMASPRDAIQGSLRTVLASGIANRAGLDPAMSGMVAHVLLTYPMVMNPGVAFSLSALNKGAALVNLRSSMPDSMAFLEDYQSKGLTLFESFASKEDPPTTNEVEHLDEGKSALGKLALMTGGLLIFFLILLTGPLIGSVIMVCCHKSNVNDMRPPFPDSVPEEVSMANAPHDFHEGLFSCIGPNSTCMYAFCCPWVRHADTLGGAGVMSYWIVILVFMFSGTVAGMAVQMAKTAGIALEEETVLQILMVLIFGYMRMQLRAKFGAPSKIVWVDFLYWWFCGPCSIGQEGMEVDKAQGVEVRCCCKLYDRSTGQLVGLPVKGGDED